MCLVAFLPGFFGLPPLDRDEPRFAQASKQMLETGDFVDIRFQEEARHKKPIGIYWLQSAAAGVFGPEWRDSIWVYRLPSLAGATVAVLLTFWAGTALFGAQAAFLAALMLASCILLGVEARLAKTDAVLLATVIAAQGALARAYLARRDAPPGLGNAFIFWTALGLGILVKGPLILLVSGATTLALTISERRAAWLKTLRPVSGIPWMLAIVLPWFLAISIASHGAFFAESAGHDLLGKIVGGQESHGAPPGYFLIAFWGTFWPWSLLAALCVPFAWKHRREPALRFCVAWLVPSWIVFELVTTKLPHYILPVYPALAMIAAAGTLGAFGWTGNAGKGWRFWVPAGIWGALTVAAAIAAPALPVIAGRGFDILAVFAAVLAVILLVAAFMAIRRDQRHAAVALCLGASLITAAAVFQRVLPQLDDVWISPRLAAAVAAHGSCPDTQVASAGYTEPSLVFLLGTDTQLVGGAQAALFLAGGPCRMAIVEHAHREAFDAAAATLPTAPQEVAALRGFNLNGGRRLDFAIFRMPPSLL
ncbi:MAG: ArnT family glycosyltransferase [Alphaproteobacteria bacterium]